MVLDVRGIRYQLSEATKEFLEKKLTKLSFAESYIQNLDIVITRLTVGQGYHLDAKLHFVWGSYKVVSADCYELYEGIENLVDKTEAMARKEKGKVVDH